MIEQVIIGALLICFTVAIHAVALDRMMVFLESVGPKIYRFFRRSWRIPMLVITVLGVFLAHIVQIWVWAVFYFIVTDLDTFEAALYFSTSTFTTVGYGDIILNEDWRLISAFQSANGFILFGWSTAFIFEITSKLYRKDTIDHLER